MASKLSFKERAQQDTLHPLTAYLYQLMATKRTNLCVSADVSTTSALLRLAEEVGDHICVLKTHCDIVDDFSSRTVNGLKDIATRKKFLIFEDRKFGDIGSTVQAQYTRGLFRIIEWAHIVNCHVFPGPAIVTALKEAADKYVKECQPTVETSIYAQSAASSSGDTDESEDAETSEDAVRKSSIYSTTTITQTFEQLGRTISADADFEHLESPPCARGLLLLAEMSSEGNLMTGSYPQHCVQSAQSNSDFVMGFIAQRSLNNKGDNFVTMTPGVNLPPAGSTARGKVGGDNLGQQYRDPETVIVEDECDIVIVGRGIIKATDRVAEAKRYREAAWAAYEKRIARK